jgi:hypothetical protein
MTRSPFMFPIFWDPWHVVVCYFLSLEQTISMICLWRSLSCRILMLFKTIYIFVAKNWYFVGKNIIKLYSRKIKIKQVATKSRSYIFKMREKYFKLTMRGSYMWNIHTIANIECSQLFYGMYNARWL